MCYLSVKCGKNVLFQQNNLGTFVISNLREKYLLLRGTVIHAILWTSITIQFVWEV
jgi:hypothetical protein